MSARPRIVHVYKGYPPVRGGIEGHIDLLTRLHAACGIDSEVLCASVAGAPARQDCDGVRVRRCASLLTLASTPLTPMLPVALHRSRADVVHLHYPWPPGEVAWLLAGRARTLVVTVHCEVLRHRTLARLLSPLTQRVFRAASGIVVGGAFLRDLPLLAAHAARVRLVPFGVDLQTFRPTATVTDPLPHVPHPRILFVGRLRHYKGLPILAAALARLPQAHLVVAGDGPERHALGAALHDYRCRDRAHLLGEVDDDTLLRLLQTADAATLPSTSRAEAFGLAIAEAQACGVPAVVTNVGSATAYTVNDGVSGRVVTPNDAGALADALAWCLDPRGETERRAAARAHAEGMLCGRRMAAAIASVYGEVLAASRPWVRR